ncbi:TPA: hypothetical protein ACH3X2_001212 [Trebouxia sp. C0005]
MPHGPVNVPTLKVSLELQLLCVQAQVEEVGQALLRKTQDAGGVGPRRKGKHSRFHMDAYKKHMLLPDARPSGDQPVHHEAEGSGLCPGAQGCREWRVLISLMEIPPAEVRWAIPWQADQIHMIALKVQRKYNSEPSKDSQQWASRHDQLVQADKGLPQQELPATMLSMDYTRVWYTDKRNTQRCISFWQPVAPPGYLRLGHVPSIRLDPPADPVLVYSDDSEKGSRPSVKPAREFHLIWRQNGRSPVTMWEPLPPQGYRALGTVVVPDAEQPSSKQVLCVREDLCAKTSIFDSPIWKFQLPIMQASLQLLTLELQPK